MHYNNLMTPNIDPIKQLRGLLDILDKPLEEIDLDAFKDVLEDAIFNIEDLQDKVSSLVHDYKELKYNTNGGF